MTTIPDEPRLDDIEQTVSSPSRRAPGAARRPAFLAAVPHISGLILGTLSVVIFLSSLSPAFRHLIASPRMYVDQYYFPAPDTSFAWAFVLGLLSAALSARKRIAFVLLIVYLLLLEATNISAFLPDHSWHALAASVFEGILIVLLFASYRHFDTRVRRGAAWLALATLIAGLAAGTLLGWALANLFPGSLPPGQRLVWAFNRVVVFATIDSSEFDGRAHGFVNSILGLFGALALIAATVVLFRSQRSANALTGPDESALRGLLERYGADDSLGYFATRRDKAVIFAPSGKAAITYRVEVGVCLASGDPIGDREAWPQAINAFLELAENYGWTPAVMGASQSGATAYSRAGLTTLELGDEAILHPRSYNLSGRDMRVVRQAVMRARRAGLTVRIRRHHQLSDEDLAATIERADAWRDTESERGFSMALGRLGDPADGECLLVEAVAPDGEVFGILSLVPWGRNGVSLDLMRRSPRGPNGVMELMVSELAAQSETHGITRISLNFAMFRSAFEEGARIGAGPVLRLWRSVLLFFSRWWQLEALYRSNMKYQPQWLPRYVCFEDNRLIPRVGVASAIAEGFLVLPKLGKRQPHTGQHASVPQRLVDTGRLHDDGSAPDGLPAPVHEIETVKRPEQVRVRLRKLEQLTESGVDGYPIAYPPTHTIGEALACPSGTSVRLSGRLLRIRDYGGVIFAMLSDWSGEIQLMFERDTVGASEMDAFTASFDLGDLVEASGSIGKSNKGTLSLVVRQWRMLGKCLHPLPNKWTGLQDPEARVRQRFIDLAINPDARKLTIARSAVLTSLRNTLADKGYLEVETPILQSVHGGANATPFTTHINAYDLDLYLRIAPELYLKRLCVGGMERVFEIGRTFRNEGVDFKHNPEFTILEAYEAHSDYRRMLDLARELIQNAAIAAHGEPVVYRPDADGQMTAVDISGNWPIISVHEAISRALQQEVTPTTGVGTLRRLCDAANIPYQQSWDAGHVVLEMYEHLVEAHTEMPTFYTDFPTSVSPLTRSHRSIPGVTERWDLVAFGVELGTAYSELTDPVEQRRRLTAQSLLAAGGDPEAMELDEDFLQALEHAMPPTGGLGMGVDRVVMLITGRSIRETLPFPLAKPR